MSGEVDGYNWELGLKIERHLKWTGAFILISRLCFVLIYPFYSKVQNYFMLSYCLNMIHKSFLPLIVIDTEKTFLLSGQLVFILGIMFQTDFRFTLAIGFLTLLIQFLFSYPLMYQGFDNENWIYGVLVVLFACTVCGLLFVIFMSLTYSLNLFGDHRK